ncbi:MAG: hypothetical protein M1312_01760, partial [Patescibacteria group bacterium]|nr:hypothetical protein [Patescibacteria group bacterium]
AANSGNPDPTTYAIGSNLSITPFIHGLVGYWPLNEGSGSTAKDESGYAYNGVIENTSWSSLNCLTSASCLSFAGSGSGDYVYGDGSSNPNLPNEDQNSSVLSWANTATSTGGIIFAEGDSSGWGYYLGTGGSAVPGEWFVGSPTQAVSCSSMSYGTWYMLTATYNASTRFLSIYMNDVLCNSNQLGAFTPNDLGHSYNIAASNAGPISNWDGSIELTRVYDTILTAAQIQAIYNVEKP